LLAAPAGLAPAETCLGHTPAGPAAELGGYQRFSAGWTDNS